MLTSSAADFVWSSPSGLWSLAFTWAVLLSTGLQLWLIQRQMRHVWLHRGAVPEAFASRISLQAHQKAAHYSMDKARLAQLGVILSAALLMAWTLLGGLDLLNQTLLETLAPRFGSLGYQLSLLAVFALVGFLLEWPLEAYATFGVEKKHGFNRSTPALFVADSLKGLALSALLGLPLAALVLWLMGQAGSLWWWWAWCVWAGFNLLLMVIYPTLIAPRFNRFEPLRDAALTERVHALMARCKFRAQGLYVMDGSRRSAHANAYFTGLGRSKRVVFYDTLLSKLTPEEVEAVLAHELGHFSHRHVQKRLAVMLGLSLAGFAVLGQLSGHSSFYLSLGVQPSLHAPNDALALLLFGLLMPTVSILFTPIASYFSRRDEFEADAYACAHAQPQALFSALLKLHEDNASTLTPDPLYARVFYSHPPALERLSAMPQAPCPAA
jgi:STE24 endopeptidase